MPLTKASFAVINVAGTITSTTVGNTTSIPSFTFDQNGVITSASNTAISGAGITANTVANSAFQTGSVENYLRGANLDFGMRNRIINGDMKIDQRRAGASVTIADEANFTYTLDRWSAYSNVLSKFSVQQDSSANTVSGFTSSLKVTSLAATSLGTSDQYSISQQIEGLNVADLGWGTANAKTVTLSFWVRSSLTGTFGGVFTNSALDRGYGYTYTINSANTWEQKSVTIPGDTTGTWLTTNGVGIRVYFGLGVGSTLSVSPGAWTAGGFRSATGATSVVGTNGATWYVTGVQLEAGSQATSFDYRPYGTELALCQRYYQRSYNIGTATGTSFNANYEVPAYFIGTGNFGFLCGKTFLTSMRANPTITVYADDGTAGSVTPWNSSPSGPIASVNAIQNGITAGNFNNNTVVGVVYGFAYTASAEL